MRRSHPSAKRASPRKPIRLRLEELEDRRTPAAITVTTVADDLTPNDGTVSLREAISAVNAGNDLGDPDITAQNPGTFGTSDTINFNIAGAGVHSISPTANLPTITRAVTVDGYSQPGASPNTLANGDNAVLKIELNGSSLAPGPVPFGLDIATSNSIVRGLVINNFLRVDPLFGTFGVGFRINGDGNRLEGNFIGTDITGTIPQPNGQAGVIVLGSDNRIGGTGAAARNLISGNAGIGLSIVDAGGPVLMARNVVQGNFIGTDVSGTAALGNDNGVGDGNSPNNTIGGTVSGAGNVIAFNRTNGVIIQGGAATTGNAIRGNSIFANGGLGINLDSAGPAVTANDPGDADTGVNNLQNFPVLASAVSTAGTTTITGALNSTPNRIFFLDFYSSPDADPSGLGEGKDYLGAVTVTTDANGNASFTTSFPVALAAGQVVTATATTTATAPFGDTSEFSQAVEASVPPVPPPPPPRLFAVGVDQGSLSVVKVYNADGSLRLQLMPFGSFTGGVRVATGDVTGDGVPDIIAASGPNGPPQVKVFDGVSGAELLSFLAYDAAFGGGVFVGAGDVNGDGKADIITGAGASGGPHVKVFDGTSGNAFQSFFAYEAAFTGGVTVAAGDVNGDGLADVITGAGPNGGPHVKAFDGVTGTLLRSFFAFNPAFTGGVFVAGGDVNADGKADIIVGQGSGGTSKVRAFDGLNLAIVRNFDAYPGFSGGARVGAVDFNGDGIDDIVTGAGPTGGPHVKVLDGTNPANVLASFFAFDPSFLGGVFVG